MDSQSLEEGLANAGKNPEVGSNPQEELSGVAANGNGHVSGEQEYMSVDDMLVKHVGEFGWAQFWHFVFVSLAWTVEALHTLVMIFGDRVPEWRCLPHSGLQVGGVNDTLSVPMCSVSSKLCELDPRAWEWVGGRSRSTVSEWNLICGNEYKAGLAESLFFIGVLFGAGIYGSLSDSFLGRKGSLALACITAVSLGLLTSLAPSYWVYSSLRFMTGLNCGGIGLCSFVLATEIVGPNKRGSVGMSAFYFFSSGIMILPLFGYFSPSWRMLYVATAVPGMLYCSLVLPFMWESPRWYLVKGRVGDAMRVMRAFAKWNGGAVPEGVHLRLDSFAEEDGNGEQVQQGEKKAVTSIVAPNAQHVEEAASLISSPKKDRQGECVVSLDEDDETTEQQCVGTLLDVFKYSETRWRMIIMICIWFFTGVVYYGISLNVVNLGFNLYVSVFVNGLIEVPAFAVTAILLGKLGRKAMLVLAMSLSGVCCLLGSFIFVWGVPDKSAGGDGFRLGSSRTSMASNGSYLQRLDVADSGLKSSSGASTLMGVLRLSCGVLGIFGMAGTYNLIYIYTTELFPTVVRNAALGLASQAAGIGSVISPFIVVVGHFAPSIPFLLFGVLALAGAALATRLPETLNQPLSDTMEGMERTECTKVDDAKKVSSQENSSQASLQFARRVIPVVK